MFQSARSSFKLSCPVEAELLVRRAVPDDLDAAVQVITEVSAWLASKGISWLTDFPGPFPKRIKQREVYLAYLDDWQTLAGTISLSRDPDAELWSNVSGEARYVHRLAVRRNFGGRGIGACLLDLAGHLTGMEGIPWLRLDCHKDNHVLLNYYINQGFEHLNTIDLPHRLSGALFQRHAKTLPYIVQLPDGGFSITLLAARDDLSASKLPHSNGRYVCFTRYMRRTVLEPRFGVRRRTHCGRYRELAHAR